MYRLPGPYTDFLKEFADFLSDLLVNVDKALIVGDFNIHVDNTNDALGLAFTDDDTQLYISTRPDETSKLSKLTECVKSIKYWMTNNFLLLNSDKTEILLIGPKNSTQNLLDYNLQLDRCTVASSTVKNLGVILDSNLSFENHISHVTKTAFFHLRNIAKLRNMLSVSDAEKLVHAFMTSGLL